MLKNKVAIVTGGARGIGYAVVEEVAKWSNCSIIRLPAGNGNKSGCFLKREK